MMDSFQYLFILIPPMLLTITVHEYAHGLVADRLGDPTPRMVGRLSLNPFKHLDPIGTIVFFLTRMIGWAKPVPVNPFNLRNGERSMVWVALAGPLSNLLLAIIGKVLYEAFFIAGLHQSLPPSWAMPLLLMLKTGIMLNLALAVFNLIPIPPLDGGRILLGILPKGYNLTWLERYGFIILIFLIFTGTLNLILMPFLHYTSLIFGIRG